jgi:hypothetical protein
MNTKELLQYYRNFRNIKWNYSDWDERDEWNDHIEMLELKTELSQREHIPRKDRKKSKIERQRLAKKHKNGRRGHKK